MAANQLRAMYARIGFNNGADDNIIDVQQINSTTELGYLNDEDVVNLCKTIRRPGGHLPNPAFVAGGAFPATIPYTGIMVSQRAETNLQLAAYTVRHYARISRNINIPAMNPTSVRRLRELKIKESSRDGDPPTLPKIDPKNWPKTIDAIQDHFSTLLGETKAPLAYVIRDMAAVPDEVDDPPENYATPEEEMISRMPHVDAAGDELPTYQHDRTKVWQSLSEMTRDEKCWTYVKPFQRARDGRGAFMALHTHYLGANHVNNMASEAESRLAKAMYHGEKRRYNFESYISALNEQFQILNGLQRYGYSGIDEASKVRRLNTGIKTDKLNAPKAQIMASRALQNNFEEAVGLYQDFISQTRAQYENDNINVSGFEGGGGTNGSGAKAGGTKYPHAKKGGGYKGNTGGKRKHTGGGGDIEDRHYSPAEYSRLSDGQKTKLKALRTARGGPDTKKDTRQAAQLLTRLSKLEAMIAQASTEADEDQEDDQDAGNTNRNHKALKRPKRG
jgi:hypothetical protein